MPGSSDTRLLIAGAATFLALVAYLAVAFANTHAAATSSVHDEAAPWTPYGSTLVPVRSGETGRYVVHVTRAPAAAKLGAYGALVPTLIPEPEPGTRFVVGLWLKESRPGRIGVQIQTFRTGSPSRYLVERMVPVTRRWRHFSFAGRVAGSWVGVSIYVYRLARGVPTPSFAIRGLDVKLR